MRKVALVALIVILSMAPTACLSGVAILVAAGTPAAAACGFDIGAVPGTLRTTTSDGVTVTLDQRQLTRAATIASVGSRTPDVGHDGVRIALMAALTESSLRQLANTGAYPESARFPNDGNGGDHDSLGLFQMRPSTGWGTVAQLMDATYQAKAFFGGPTGPNRGSPRGLLDIRGWRTLDPGEAAQAVEVSAFPDRYARFRPVADAILTALTADSNGESAQPVAETTRTVFPLPAKTWVRSSSFGRRTDPVTGVRTIHTGTDFASPLGTPILAVADGQVVFAGPVTSGYGHLILIEHTINDHPVFSGYAHMFASGIHVTPGDLVTAGQHIADVGQDGKSTGPHLHFEIRPGEAYATPVDPEPFLRNVEPVDSQALALQPCRTE
ncbi:putative peptidase [Nocardioidaceae bacterium Broad-1]|nr:putative peptidase [Nocardioidaceae bacterium Broad-1]